MTFTPLKDLLLKNHDDRVQDYINKMEGLTLKEVIESNTFKNEIKSPK